MVDFEAIVAGFFLIGSLVYSVKKVPRKGGKKIIYHVIFGSIAIVLTIVLPLSSRKVLFSPLTTSIVGNVFPLSQSIRAVCTPQTTDDKVWLQYWIAAGIVTLIFESLDDFTIEKRSAYVTFYTVQFFYYFWLLLPFTNGAGIIHKYVTIPFLTPLVDPVRKRCQGLLSFLTSLSITAVHMYVVVLFFIFLPTEIKRFVAIAIGTVYPTIASIGAAATPEPDDDTFWLTYWSCYGSLYLIVDFLETFLGDIPGFYAGFIVGILYLMIPVVNGADKVFRNILVPLTNQHDMLIYRDAIAIRRSVQTKIKEQDQEHMTKTIGEVFTAPWEDIVRCHEFVDPDLLDESGADANGSEPLIAEDDESGIRQRHNRI